MYPVLAEWSSDFPRKRIMLEDVIYDAIGNNNEKNSNVISNGGLPKNITKMVVDYLEDYLCFGESQWQTVYKITVDPAPPLPHGFYDFWNGTCSIFPEKKIKDTHILVYIPATVDGEPLTLKKVEQIAKVLFREDADWEIVPGVINMLGDKRIDKSRWVMMTKDVLPKSNDKSWAHQKKMIAKLNNDFQRYEVPEVLEATICSLARFYFDRSFEGYTTRCKEVNSRGGHMGVADINMWGLIIHDFYEENMGICGIAPMIKL